MSGPVYPWRPGRSNDAWTLQDIARGDPDAPTYLGMHKLLLGWYVIEHYGCAPDVILVPLPHWYAEVDRKASRAQAANRRAWERENR